MTLFCKMLNSHFNFAKLFLLFICLLTGTSKLLAHDKRNSAMVPIDSLDSLNVTIDEVLVSGKRPTAVTKNGIINIRIEGTSLETMGELADMLPYVPGMILRNNEIEVLERGTPLYLLNGIEMKDEKVIFALRSEQIKKIEIIKYPSSAYPSGTRAVVNIITKSILKDNLSIDIASTTRLKRKVSESPNAFISFKKGKWLMNLSYYFKYLQNLNKETYYRNIYSASRIFHGEWQRKDHDIDRMHDINYSVNYNLSDKQKFGFTYLFSHDAEENPITGLDTESSNAENTIMKNVIERCKNKINVHSMNFNWAGSLSENSTVQFIQDISFYSKKGTTDVKEQNIETLSLMHNITGAINKSDIYSTNLKYENADIASMDCSIGLRYDYFKTQMQTDVNDIINGICKNHNKCQSIENIYSAYAELSKGWDNFELTAGVRYEHLLRSQNDYSESNENSKFKTNSIKNLFPHLNITYNPNEDFSLLLNYETEVTNPSLEMLNSGKTYKDSLTYSMGNSDIKSSYTHTLSFEVDWRMLNFGVEYEYTKNYIITPYIQLNDESDITCSMPVNLNSLKELSLLFGFNKTWKKLNANLNAKVGFPYSKIMYLNEDKTLKKPYITGTLSMTYEFYPSIQLYTHFMYQGASETINTIQKSLNSLDIGITGKIGRMKYSLSFNDLLHCAHYNNSYDIYQNVKDGTYGTNDLRGLRLNISYNIFSKKKEIDDKICNYNILNRL